MIFPQITAHFEPSPLLGARASPLFFLCGLAFLRFGPEPGPDIFPPPRPCCVLRLPYLLPLVDGLQEVPPAGREASEGRFFPQCSLSCTDQAPLGSIVLSVLVDARNFDFRVILLPPTSNLYVFLLRGKTGTLSTAP